MRRFPAAAWSAIGIACLAVFYGNLRFGPNVLAVGLEDDFFYYAQIAHNLAFHGISTFDGIHLTNGYHPLWLLVITVLTKIFAPGGILGAASVVPFAVALETVQSGLVIAISYLTFRICSLLCSVRAGLWIMLFQASFSVMLVRSGMEVGLTVSLALALLWLRLRPQFHWEGASSFKFGLLASLCILSRLDAILFVGLIILSDRRWRNSSFRTTARNAFWFTVGTIPLMVYFTINQMVFGAITPVSGMAKQMRFHHIPSSISLRSFASFILAAGSPLLGLCIVSTFLAIILLMRNSRKDSSHPSMLWAPLLFPFLHLLIISTLSDWKLWPWYLYPWLLSAVVALAVVFSEARFNVFLHRPYAAPISFAVPVLFLLTYTGTVATLSNPSHNLTYAVGLELREFATTHPGIYAMGDRAGAVGFLIGQPVIQLEGLTMDKKYLANIREQRDLGDVLREYSVRYYVSTRSYLDEGACYPVKEPWQAGPDSPSMATRICKAPVAVYQHGGFVNHVFDMQVPQAK